MNVFVEPAILLIFKHNASYPTWKNPWNSYVTKVSAMAKDPDSWLKNGYQTVRVLITNVQRMLKTPSCLLIALQPENHDTEVITCCKADSPFAFNRRAVWEDGLPLKPYWWNPEQKNLMWGQWVKVLAYLCSAWNCVQWNSSCHKVLTQAWTALLRNGKMSTQFMDKQELKAELWHNCQTPSKHM